MENYIVPAHLVVKSMRDNGYKNTAYAIAELIDNSIQHGSSQVNLICLEDEVQIGLKTVSRIKEIAVLDNGNGMNKATLQKALQFGNGTNLEKEHQKGIGKFGMGLPSSSISQAIRVEVWTWQNGIENAIYSYLDIHEITEGKMTFVPEPVEKTIPEKWATIAENLNTSGTLVVWSKLDRCLWKTGKTIIEHSEFIVGRMYRKFIDSKQVKIISTVVKEGSFSNKTQKEFLANDPLYLMADTSVKNALIEEGIEDPMFEKLGGDDGYEKIFTINFDGQNHNVHVRYSIAKEATRKGFNPGAKKHGKHAGGNIGVSILRAGRELDLDTSWIIGYDPRERWWGIEVEFQPSLDEVFGVTNNKQFANNFKELGYLDLNQLLEDRNQTISEFKEELIEENDYKALLIDIAKDIKNQLSVIRSNIRAQASRLEKNDKKTRHSEPEDEAEQHATEITESRKEDGHIGQSDKDEEKPEDEKLQDIFDELKEDDVPEAEDFAKTILSSNVKYQFIEASFESPAFFSVVPKGGKIIIKLNVNHPAYNQFVEVLNDDIAEDISLNELKERLSTAKNGMKLLLMAWARHEDEQPDGKRKNIVKDTRIDWGKMASEFMDLDD